MEWITAKTDWTAEDVFNAVDYNRIKNNINYVADRLSGKYDISIMDMGEDLSYEAYPNASQLSLFPRNLSIINNSSYQLITIEDKVYSDNDIAPNYNEWNRIESALDMFRTFYKSEEEYIPHLDFRLGNYKMLGKRIGG